MKFNTDNFIEELKCKLTGVNTGSYEADDCGEDYFDDVENLDEIIEYATEHCVQYNDGKITYEELLNKLSNIQTEWDTSPFKGFHSFKEDIEPLGDTLYSFKDFLDECLDK